MSASRSTGGYGDGVVDAKITAPQIPRIVWMLWFQGWDRAPYVCKNCKSLGNWTSLHGERWWKIMNYDDDPSDPLDSTQVSYNLQCVKWQWLSVRFLSLSSESLNSICFRKSFDFFIHLLCCRPLPLLVTVVVLHPLLMWSLQYLNLVCIPKAPFAYWNDANICDSLSSGSHLSFGILGGKFEH